MNFLENKPKLGLCKLCSKKYRWEGRLLIRDAHCLDCGGKLTRCRERGHPTPTDVDQEWLLKDPNGPSAEAVLKSFAAHPTCLDPASD